VLCTEGLSWVNIQLLLLLLKAQNYKNSDIKLRGKWQYKQNDSIAPKYNDSPTLTFHYTYKKI